MKRSREEHRKAMEAELEAALEELMQWEEGAEAPTMSEIEEKVLEVRQRMGQRMAEELLTDQEAAQPAEAPKCPTCGEEMRNKGKKEVVVESRLGPLRMQRGHYYCAHCQSGLFPPG
jgi:uncharacterized protein with PIN domain